MTRDGEHAVVRERPSGSRVNEDMNILIDDMVGGGLVEHDVQEVGFEDLLGGIEGQTTQFGLDQVRTVSLDKKIKEKSKKNQGKVEENQEILTMTSFNIVCLPLDCHLGMRWSMCLHCAA